MDPIIGGALISGAISIGLNFVNSLSQKKANKIAAAESANAAARNYTETSRQKQVSQKLFKTEMTNAYGADFLTGLTEGADTTALIESLANGNTAFSKELQGMENDAKQAIENSILVNQKNGQLSAMQGLQNAFGMKQLGIQSEQALGAAVASQASSGIRSDAGTGSNAQKIQEQSNENMLREMQLQIALQNKTAMVKAENEQISASQEADTLRRKANVSAQEKVEKALSSLAGHQAEQKDFEVSMEGYEKDYEYLKGKAGKQADMVTEELKFWDEE